VGERVPCAAYVPLRVSLRIPALSPSRERVARSAG
jgi:hypothetical protein